MALCPQASPHGCFSVQAPVTGIKVTLLKTHHVTWKKVPLPEAR